MGDYDYEAMPRLLMRPKILRMQCKYDYLMQIALSNGFSGIPSLCKLYEISPSEIVNFSEENIYLLISGNMTKENLLALTNTKKRFHNGLYTKVKICPLCISENSPISKSIHYGFTFVCTTHNALVHDKCPLCGGGFRYIRTKKSKCDAGCNLSPELFPDLDCDYVYAQQIFSPWKFWNIQPGLSENLLDIEYLLLSIFYSICELTIRTYRTDRALPLKLIEIFTLEVTQSSYAFSTELKEFYANSLSEHVIQSSQEFPRMVKEVRKLYRNTPTFQWFHWNGAFDCRND